MTKLKLTIEHQEHIRNAISKFDTIDNRFIYVNAGLSDRRYRWDLLHRAGLGSWLCSNVYSYANDEHVDSLLRKLVKPLNRGMK